MNLPTASSATHPADTGAACRLSVVMPTLNQAAFIDAAIHSVMAQGIEGLELIVKDGGSTDETSAIVAAWVRRHPGVVRWVARPDSGPAQAINQAIALARAPLIGWLNSDDLYLPGALARAMRAMVDEPSLVMVYGEGVHVDVQGREIGAYPTLLPSAPLQSYRDGCHICQPTAVFTREAFQAVGGLDESLGAAFDFDLWLKMFARFPGRIGHLGAVQAASRLHAGGITARMRARVAHEGILVVARHFGSAPSHWLLTHLEELVAIHPFESEPVDLQAHFKALVTSHAGLLDIGATELLLGRLREDRRLALSTPNLQLACQADGWMAAHAELRVRHPGQPFRAALVSGRYPLPDRGAISISVTGPGNCTEQWWCDTPGIFKLVVPMVQAEPGALQTYRITVSPPYIPAEFEEFSRDERPLGFRVDAVRALTQAS